MPYMDPMGYSIHSQQLAYFQPKNSTSHRLPPSKPTETLEKQLVGSCFFDPPCQLLFFGDVFQSVPPLCQTGTLEQDETIKNKKKPSAPTTLSETTCNREKGT